MRVTAWSNGSASSSVAGYGLRVTPADRDMHFDRGWEHVEVDLGIHGPAAIPLSESFWARCTELRSASVGRWLLAHRLAPWPNGSPPKLELLHLGGNAFQLSPLR